MEKAYLELKGLSVGYNNKPVVKDIDFQIKKGEVITLIGPNGAGKSTILKSLARQLGTLSGKVFFQEKDLNCYTGKELAQKLSVVFTQRHDPELMTCFEVAALGRYPYTGRLGILGEKDREKVLQALSQTHALDIADREFSRISDGQRQRVLLARAICQEPEVMILDEPTSFLDIKFKLELLGILRKMARERGITVILSLHEIDLAMKISDRILCVKGEYVFSQGTPEEIFKEETIRELYEVKAGNFDPLFGSLELQKTLGKPEVFVISSSGKGIPVYRALSRRQIPFACGILYTNDLDYQGAKSLAVQVVTEKPFCRITEEKFEQAKELIDGCKRVVNAGVEIGEINGRLLELIAYAKERGKLDEQADTGGELWHLRPEGH